MITLFRRIREKLIGVGNVRRYMLYAIGEILLVVIGILIALQINNWNEQRKVMESETIILRSAIESLREDSVLIEGALAELEKIDQLHKQIFDYTMDKLPAEDIGNLMYLRRSLLYNPITKNNHPDLPNEVLRQDMKQHIRGYYKTMDDAMYVITNFNEFVEESVRPIFTEAKLNKFGFQFSQDMEPVLLGRQGLKNINRDALIAYLDDPFFQNLLVEVGIKYTITGLTLNNLQVENAALIQQLTAYLKGR